MSVSSNILNENSRNFLREVTCCDDEIHSTTIVNDETTTIRVLLVDADSNSSLIMKNHMTQFSYQVTRCENGEDAIAFLMKNKDEIDLVIWDLDTNGLEALKTIVLARDHNKETVIKSTTYDACDFLVKPVSKEVIAVLWRHVFLRRMSKSGLSDSVESEPEEDDTDVHQSQGSKTAEYSGEQNTSGGKSKKPRMTWTRELHEMFEAAVDKMGSLEKAYPKQILKCMQEEMKVQGLTRNNVASHLQKYRLGANKKNHAPQDTQQDLGWNNHRSTTALAASRPLLNLPCCRNDQAVPIQYPPSTFQTLNNNNPLNALANFPHVDQMYQPQQQQQRYYSPPVEIPCVNTKPQQQQQQQYYSPPVEIPCVNTKQENGVVSTMGNSDQLIYDPTLPYDPDYYYPGYNDLGEFNNPNPFN